MSRQICPIFLRDKERRIKKTCVQSASVEPVGRVLPFQDEGNACSDADDYPSGLDDQNRSPRHLFLCGDSTRTSKVSKIPDQQLVIRLGVGTKVVHKAVEVSFLRRLGIRLVIYLDDLILLNQNAETLIME